MLQQHDYPLQDSHEEHKLLPSVDFIGEKVIGVLFNSSEMEEVPEDNPQLILLFFMVQLLLRELTKCYRLVQIIPMDMSGYYGGCQLCD